MDGTVDIVEYVSKLIDSGKYKEALSIPDDKKYENSFNNNCWDLISIIVSKINDETLVIQPSLYGACEKLLSIITEKGIPEESLLEFIEQIEEAKNDAQLSIIIMPLQQLLKRLTVKRGRSLEWCLNSITTYIERIPIPDYQLEGEEWLLMDCDNNIRRMTKVYSLLPPFYNPFIEELKPEDVNYTTTKEILSIFLISLLGKPLIFIDLDPDSNAKSEIRDCCTAIVRDLCKLEKNVLKFFLFINSSDKEPAKSKYVDINEEEKPHERQEKINMTTLSGLYYAVFSDHFEIPDIAIPNVYSFEYMLHNIILCTIHLLSFYEYGAQSKAVALFKATLSRIQHIPSSLLKSPGFYEVCKSLINITLYSSFETVRKNAVQVIGSYINKFDNKGRCKLIKYVIDTANHSGMIGFVITLYKNTIDEAFAKGELEECFTGSQLTFMVKKICYLPNGAESDLVAAADQIISALNFLRYLVLKDTQNVTGIRDCFTFIEKEYLEKIRTGLNMSKAHYEVKLKDFEEGRDDPYFSNANVCVNGTNMLDDMPIEKKKEIMCSALNALHLIEGLLARLLECFNVNKV